MEGKRSGNHSEVQYRNVQLFSYLLFDIVLKLMLAINQMVAKTIRFLLAKIKPKEDKQ